MLLQPDSALYIIPAEGGQARRLECNTSRMNSWHSWSPNGKWLVFSSKAYSPYTQLFLTHVDEQGHSTPAVVLSHFTSSDMAANIPEFVNAAPEAIRSIRAEFIDDLSFLQAGKWNVHDGHYDLAIRDFQKALEINPENVEAQVALGSVLLSQGGLDEARRHLTEALSRDPANSEACMLLGAVFERQGDFLEAMERYRHALEIDPEHAMVHQSMGRLALAMGSTDEGRKHLLESARLDPGNASPYIDLAHSFLRQQRQDQAIAMYREALQRAPDSEAALVGLAIALIEHPSRRPPHVEEALQLATKACTLTNGTSPPALIVLAEAYAAAGRLPEAASVARRALAAAQQAGRPDLAATARSLLDRCEREMAAPRPR
jgi:tetratricopeptide (TPR) repeat protein